MKFKLRPITVQSLIPFFECSCFRAFLFGKIMKAILIIAILLIPVLAGADPFNIDDSEPIYFGEDYNLEWEGSPSLPIDTDIMPYKMYFKDGELIIRELPPDLNDYVFKLENGILYYEHKNARENCIVLDGLEFCSESWSQRIPGPIMRELIKGKNNGGY